MRRTAAATHSVVVDSADPLHGRRRGWLLVAAFLGAAVGCAESSAPRGGDGGPGPTDGGEEAPEASPPPPPPVRTYAPTFEAIYTEIFDPTCAGPFCHIDGQAGFEVSSPDRTFENLRQPARMEGECGHTGLRRVVPGKPEESLLYLKLTDPPCGKKMPLLFNPNLDPRELEQIRVWIERGALRHELGDGAAPDGDAEGGSDGPVDATVAPAGG